jgi:hypothetical protein
LADMSRRLRHNPRLDAPLRESGATLAEIANPTVSAEDAYLNSEDAYHDGIVTDTYDDQRQKSGLILHKLNDLSPVEQAAVLAVFDLYDLMSNALLRQGYDDTEKLCQAFGVADYRSLELHVHTRILPKISELNGRE